MSQPSRSLPAKLAEVLGVMKHIPKNGYNEAQRYSFVRDADVLDAVREALAERNVATLVDVAGTEVTEYQTARQRQDGGVSWMTTVWGAISFLDGDSDATVAIGFRGTGSDTGDKGYYKALTGGVKYALLKTFLIPTGDDPEAETAAPGAPAPRPAPRPVAPAAPQRPTAAPAPAGVGMTLAEALRALEGIDKRAIGDKAKELYGNWSLKALTPEQRAHVVADLIGEEDPKPVSRNIPPPPDDEWGALLDTVPAA